MYGKGKNIFNASSELRLALKCYYDEKMLFSFSVDSDCLYLAKMHHDNHYGSISKITVISRFNCPPLPDSVSVELH